MKKIPSVFKRDFGGDPKTVLNEVTPGCEWVLAGEGVPTVKRDGTAMLVKDGRLWKRYSVPPGAIPCEEAPDENTGHWPHWVPFGYGPDDKWAREAWADGVGAEEGDGTYELVGPKVQGNPHGLAGHVLFRHGGEELALFLPHTFEDIRQFLEDHPLMEGLVWHHPDGRMAKIKRRDFGFPWPPQQT